MQYIWYSILNVLVRVRYLLGLRWLSIGDEGIKYFVKNHSLLDDKRWRLGLGWGQYHPNNPIFWWRKAPPGSIPRDYRVDVMKEPKSGFFPAVWMYSSDGIGEIDLMEQQKDGSVTSTIHYGDYSKGHKRTKAIPIGNKRQTEDPHYKVRIVLVREDKFIKLYFDDRLVKIYSGRAVKAIQNDGMNLIVSAQLHRNSNTIDSYLGDIQILKCLWAKV